MLSEQQILNRWRQLFQDEGRFEDDLQSADELLDSLADYSPVRHRLARELDELRSRHESAVASKNGASR